MQSDAANDSINAIVSHHQCMQAVILLGQVLTELNKQMILNGYF